ncbi:MAG: ribosomal-protein-alanine N-acetyltransferase [Micrococcales bacterium]|nr:MAG: ribosomal-protein-alanine N-acetyltransferase [Micrococcales bacterium]
MRWWHLDQVLALEHQLFHPDRWSAETFWAELAAPGRSYLVAVGPDEHVIGYAGLSVSGPSADVQTVAVAPSARGCGLGRALLDRLICGATQAGAGELLLEVRADNAPAQRLYAEAGFERIGIRRKYYQPEGVDALVLRLRPLPPRGGSSDTSSAGSDPQASPVNRPSPQRISTE